jgi:Lhr-like helicase
VLAQQIVAVAVAHDPEDGVRVDDLYALVTRTYSYSTLSRALFENVVDMLEGAIRPRSSASCARASSGTASVGVSIRT